MTSVYLTCPNGSAKVHKHVMFAFIKILGDKRHRVRADAPTHSPYVNNLHHCMKDFLDGGEDYWLSMDDDNPPRKNPLDLIELDCDLIGLPTPVWHSAVKGDRPYYFNAMDRVPEGFKPHEPCEGLQEVDAIGSGCFIVARRVMLALRDDQPFARQWNADGTVHIGGDFSFCDKVKAKGYRIWAHYGYPCDHFNTLSLLEVIESFQAMKP
jgi:hypothetical protein